MIKQRYSTREAKATENNTFILTFEEKKSKPSYPRPVFSAIRKR